MPYGDLSIEFHMFIIKVTTINKNIWGEYANIQANQISIIVCNEKGTV